MKPLFTIVMLATLLAAVPADAQFVNRIGIYSSPTPSRVWAEDSNPETNIYFPNPGFLDVYLVCVNPHNDATGYDIVRLGGFELNIRVELAWILHHVTLPPDIIDLDAGLPALYCSGFLPVTSHGDNGIALLATLTLLHLYSQPGVGLVYLDPYFTAPSIPGHMAVTDANDNFSLHAAETSAPLPEQPACYLNYFWDPVEDRAWGEVKALYR